MDTTTIFDALRIMGLILGSMVVGVTVVVVRAYARLYRRWQIAYAKGEIEKWKGLLPRHVTLIGVSYIGLILWTSEDMIRAFHHDITWRLPSSFILFGIGLWAMRDMQRHARHREDLW